MGKKILLGEYPVVDQEFMVQQGCEFVEDHREADFVIHFSTEAYGSGWVEPTKRPPFPREKSVMVQVEPPLAAYRQMVYHKQFLDQFHSAFVFNPDPTAENQFPISLDPSVFPYYPRGELRRKREVTSITHRRFYYAGDRHQQWGAPDAHGNVNMYPLRAEIVEKMKHYGIGHYVTGPGWKDENTRSCDDWRAKKLEEIDENDIDFVFCFENSRYPNYVSEKIHDGFNSDRVVFYLGHPDIERYVPPNAFINLSAAPFYREIQGIEPYVFAFDMLRDVLLKMSQDEYDRILANARKFRDEHLTEEAHCNERRRFTGKLLERIL